MKNYYHLFVQIADYLALACHMLSLYKLKKLHRIESGSIKLAYLDSVSRVKERIKIY